MKDIYHRIVGLRCTLSWYGPSLKFWTCRSTSSLCGKHSQDVLYRVIRKRTRPLEDVIWTGLGYCCGQLGFNQTGSLWEIIYKTLHHYSTEWHWFQEAKVLTLTVSSLALVKHYPPSISGFSCSLASENLQAETTNFILGKTKRQTETNK